MSKKKKNRMDLLVEAVKQKPSSSKNVITLPLRQTVKQSKGPGR